MSQGVLFESDRDQVVIAFPKRGQFLPVTITWAGAGLFGDRDQAQLVAAVLHEKAMEAEDWVRHGGVRKLAAGPRRVGVTVDAPNRRLMVVFDRVDATHRLPYEAARELADEIVRARFDLMALVQQQEGVRYHEQHPELKK